jgi:hypothetical protein
MTIDHNDSQLQRAFDVELAGQRAGIPGAGLDDFDYVYGMERAKLRAPVDEQPDVAKLRAMIARDLTALVDPNAEPVTDDTLEPAAQEAARLHRGALAQVRAIRDHQSRSR